MHFSTLLSGAALMATVFANPFAVAEPNYPHCVTSYYSKDVTVTKTTVKTKTAPCPIVSIPFLSKVGVTGTLVPVRSVTKIIPREPEPTPEAAPIAEEDDVELEARNGKPCTITKTKGYTITKATTTTTTVKRTGCPIVSLRRRHAEPEADAEPTMV